MLRDVLTLVVGVVAIMLALTVFLLGGVNLSNTRLSGVAGGLRTLATVGGFVLAVIAYRAWRRPEVAKRRADTAQVILRQSRKVETAALGARNGSIIVALDDAPVTIEDKIEQAGDVARTKPTEDLKALTKEVEEFRTYRAEAAELFRGTRAVVLMDSIETRAREIVQAYSTAAYLDGPHRGMLGEERFVEVLDETLRTLGVEFTNDTLGKSGGDVFKAEFVRDCDELRSVLVTFLVAE